MSDQEKDNRDQASFPDQPPADENAKGDSGRTFAQEQEDLLARLQRVSADYANYQKRVQKDIAEAHELANTGLIRSLLDVLDDMERALQAGREKHGSDDPMVAGIELVHSKLLDILRRFGLEPMDSLGKPFDPNVHAAMMEEPTDQVPAMTVTNELQKGYRLKGRTLRAARVVISKPVAQAGDEENHGGQRKD